MPTNYTREQVDPLIAQMLTRNGLPATQANIDWYYSPASKIFTPYADGSGRVSFNGEVASVMGDGTDFGSDYEAYLSKTPVAYDSSGTSHYTYGPSIGSSQSTGGTLVLSPEQRAANLAKVTEQGMASQSSGGFGGMFTDIFTDPNMWKLGAGFVGGGMAGGAFAGSEALGTDALTMGQTVNPWTTNPSFADLIGQSGNFSTSLGGSTAGNLVGGATTAGGGMDWLDELNSLSNGEGGMFQGGSGADFNPWSDYLTSQGLDPLTMGDTVNPFTTNPSFKDLGGMPGSMLDNLPPGISNLLKMLPQNMLPQAMKALGINTGGFGGSGIGGGGLMDAGLKMAPGLAALLYAKGQPGVDTSALESVIGKVGGNQDAVVRAATDPLQQNIAAGYGDLVQSQGLRGIRGSSFGDTDIANYIATTGRSLANAGANAAEGSLALQGNLAGNLATLKAKAQEIKNNLYGRAFDIMGRGLNPSPSFNLNAGAP